MNFKFWFPEGENRVVELEKTLYDIFERVHILEIHQKSKKDDKKKPELSEEEKKRLRKEIHKAAKAVDKFYKIKK